VGRPPGFAADAYVGSLGEERVLGDPRGPGGPPHESSQGAKKLMDHMSELHFA